MSRFLDDWRSCAPREVAPLLAAEQNAWLDELYWDVRAAWRVVEPARRSGQLPGFILRDRAGRASAWASFLRHHDSVQVLAFVSATRVATAALVDAILASPEAASARAVLFCVRGGAAALAPVLAERGFGVEPYRYLSARLGPARPPSESLRKWVGQTDAAARLLARAYANDGAVRAFAPAGTIAEWRDYIATLIDSPGCGRFSPVMSFVVPHERDSELAGAVLVHDLGPGTVHVSQIAVDPDVRGLGLGRRLMDAAEAAAATRGFDRMTLLVAQSNRPAAGLYERLGFRDRAAFVVATRSHADLTVRHSI
jgi:ribosomal protein S18 acetylase RimI-like enzyme